MKKLLTAALAAACLSLSVCAPAHAKEPLIGDELRTPGACADVSVAQAAFAAYQDSTERGNAVFKSGVSRDKCRTFFAPGLPIKLVELVEPKVWQAEKSVWLELWKAIDGGGTEVFVVVPYRGDPPLTS